MKRDYMFALRTEGLGSFSTVPLRDGRGFVVPFETNLDGCWRPKFSTLKDARKFIRRLSRLERITALAGGAK